MLLLQCCVSVVTLIVMLYGAALFSVYNAGHITGAPGEWHSGYANGMARLKTRRQKCHANSIAML